MSEIQIYNFDNPTNYSLNQTQIASGLGKLAVVNQTGLLYSQSFAAAGGFTYDVAKTEFAAGLVQQKNQYPNETFYADFATNENGIRGGGSLTGTLVGGASVSGGELNVIGAADYLEYAAAGNCDFTQIGTIRFKYKPNYTGIPAGISNIFSVLSVSGSLANVIWMYHSSGSGQIVFQVRSSASTVIINTSLGVWIPASQYYEFEINLDITTGATRVFIDGVQHGATQTGTGTRIAPSLFRMGYGYSPGQASNGYFDDVQAFSTVQHTANFAGEIPRTVGYRYVPDVITLPNFTYTGPEGIRSLDGITSTQVGSWRFTFNGMYWNGSAWAVSAGTYAEANDKATAVANLPSLDVLGDTLVTVAIYTTDTNSQMTMDQLDLEHTDGLYPSTYGSILTNSSINAEDISSFVAVEVIPGGDVLKYAVQVDGTLKYWNGAAWVTSTGIEAETNPLATIQANIGTLLSSQSSVKFYVLMRSAAQTSTPTIDTLTLDYDFGAVQPSLPPTTQVWGYILDHSGAPVSGATVSFQRNYGSTAYVDDSDHIITQQLRTTTTRVDGYFEILLIPGTYKFSAYDSAGTFGITKDTSGNKLLPIIPDQVSVNLADLISFP